MWLPWERDRLVVFADELLARGDSLGERIATSLAAESCEDPEQRAALLEHAAELDRRTRDPEVDKVLRRLRVFRVRREHGMVVVLELCEHPPQGSPCPWTYLRMLLRHRELRLVQVIELPSVWFGGKLSTLDVMTELVSQDLRPRVVRFVQSYGYHHQVPQGPWYELERVVSSEIAREFVDLRRGLMVFTQHPEAVCLSRLGPRENNSRADSLAARINRKPLDPVTFTWFARALWDDSLAVRRVAYAALDHYGLELAAVIPDLLLLAPRKDLTWVAQLRDALEALGQRPELVEAVAPALDLRKAGHRDWLANSARPGAASLARGAVE